MKKQIAIWRCKPATRTIVVNGLKSDFEKAERSFRLSFPHQTFVLRPRSDIPPGLYLFFSDDPIVDLNEKVGMLPLPNIGSDHSICLGDGHFDLFKNHGTLRDQLAFLISEFWSRNFCINQGLTEWVLRCFDFTGFPWVVDRYQYLNCLERWEKGNRPNLLNFEKFRLSQHFSKNKNNYEIEIVQ